MALVDGINPFNLYQAQGISPQVQHGGTPKVNPFAPGAGQVGGAGFGGKIPSNNLQAVLAWIGQNGMRANDTEMWVNQPMAMATNKQLGYSGIAGGHLRILG